LSHFDFILNCGRRTDERTDRRTDGICHS